MARRTVSIRIETEVEVSSNDDLDRLRHVLAARAARAVKEDPWVKRVYEASSVLRRPEPGDGELR